MNCLFRQKSVSESAGYLVCLWSFTVHHFRAIARTSYFQSKTCPQTPKTLKNIAHKITRKICAVKTWKDRLFLQLICIHIFCGRGAHFCKKYPIELNSVSQVSLMDIDRGICFLCSRKEWVLQQKWSHCWRWLLFGDFFIHIFCGRGASVLPKTSDGIEPHFIGALNWYR